MKNLKLITASFFGLGAIVIFLTGDNSLRIGAAEASATPTASAVTSKSSPTVTPTAGAFPAASTAANSATASPLKSALPENFSGASISKSCCDLDKDEYEGLVKFNHDAHAFKISYSIDGKSPARCIECHHTDQPQTGGLMSERKVELTYALWKDLSDKSVKNCKICHFSRNERPGEKLKFNNKEISDNFDAYHANCTDCHASASKTRSNLLGKRGFATKANGQCGVCHAGS